MILERLDVSRILPPQDKQFIRDKGLFDLFEFVSKLEETGKPDFRILRTKFERQQKTNTRRELWQKYDIDYVEGFHMRQMMGILLIVEKGSRIPDIDVVWLTTNQYFSPALKSAFHENEAMHYRKSFEKSMDAWDAVNASSHFRKANLPAEATKLLEKVDIDSQKDNHLRSALCTTKGGAKRDLNQIDEALQLAAKAHLFDCLSFHPCTLLGALNYEQGNYTLGDEWFAKAIERGANHESVDYELRSIYKRANKAQKDELKRHLINVDPNRYKWVMQTKGGSKASHNNSINQTR